MSSICAVVAGVSFCLCNKSAAFFSSAAVNFNHLDRWECSAIKKFDERKERTEGTFHKAKKVQIELYNTDIYFQRA